MKALTYISILFILLNIVPKMQAQNKSFFDFTVESIDGKQVDLSTFKGKKILVVNTASKCGLTPQYEDLEALYKEYGGDDFVIIGFPVKQLHESGAGEQ